ncbi:MAG: ethanolamine utilization protein EutJ [Christensenellales bacterium]
MNFKKCNEFVKKFESVINNPVKTKSSVYYTGVDLGTACVVMAVLDENYNPVAGAYEYSDVVKDGMVVDYIGAINIVRKMKEKIEASLQTTLSYAAAAIPPGTDRLDGGAVRNVVEAAGFEVTSLLDEPTAANKLLKLENGAVVDIGGGTTGISIIKNGEVIAVDDEPTGGTHFTLVLSGAYKIPFDEADLFKRNVDNHKEIFPVVKPVVDKIATIVSEKTSSNNIEELVLVGGSSCLTGIEEAIEKEIGIRTTKPDNPLFVTPLGIALSCTDEALN